MGVGIRIKTILRNRNMTIKQLAEKSGVSINTLYSITKRDTERVDLVILRQLAQALDIDWTELVSEENQAQTVINHVKNALRNRSSGSIDDVEMQKIADKFDISILDLFPENQQDAVKKGWLYGWEDREHELVHSFGYSFSEHELALIEYFGKLSAEGQEKAVERIQELTEIPKYQKDKNPADGK